CIGVQMFVDSNRTTKQCQATAFGIDRCVRLTAGAKGHVLQCYLCGASDHYAAALSCAACADLHVFKPPFPLADQNHCTSTFPTEVRQTAISSRLANDSHRDAGTH